jgi:hypothetical protein
LDNFDFCSEFAGFCPFDEGGGGGSGVGEGEGEPEQGGSNAPSMSPCNKTKTELEETFLQRMWQQSRLVQGLSQSTGVPVEWIIAWSQAETGSTYESAVATNNGNYFNQSVSGQGATDGIEGAVVCGAGTVERGPLGQWWACFTGYGASATFALTAIRGSSYTMPAGTATLAQLLLSAAGSQSDVAAAFEAVAASGYARHEHENFPGQYGAKLKNQVDFVTERLRCLKASGGFEW